MATPTIPNGEEHFFNILYEGNSAGQRVGKFVPFTDNGTIDNSCIFNHPDEPELSRTPSSGGNRRTFTISAWIKLSSEFGQRRMLFTQAVSGSIYFLMEVNASNQLFVSANDGSGGTDLDLITNRTFEDTSKFYHIMLAVDTTQSTASDRLKLYVDGDQVTSFSTATYPTQNYDTQVNHTVEAVIGNFITTGYAFDGYMAEVNLVDGTALTPSTFGVVDTSTNRWIPKTLSGITYGTNGFRLEFGDSSALGDDTSGNTNDFTATNLASTDQTTDSPTQNFSILASNPTAGTATLSEGNLKIAGTGSSVYGVRRATFLINSNDSNGYYFEAKNVGSSTDNINIGLISSQNALSASAYGGSNSYGIASRGSGGSNQYWRVLGGSTDVTTSVSHASNDVIGVAIKQGKIWFAINNTWVLSGDPANGTNSFFDMSSKASEFQIAFNVFQNNTLDVNFGQKSLAYTAPTGFSALQQDNLPETAKGITGLAWMKDRDSGSLNHAIYDSSRGANKLLYPNTASAELSVTSGVSKFLKGGYAVGDAATSNNAGDSFVAWNWVANGGTTASNTDGSLTSTVQANTTAGFSIITYTGNGVVSTIGHGLSQAPEWFVLFHRGSLGSNNYVYHKDIGADYMMYLNLSSAKDTSVTTPWNDTAPTSSVISLMSTGYGGNNSGEDYLIYAWHGVEGFSKFGKYTGNGSSDGVFVATNFSPSFIMFKRTDSTADWQLHDNKRDTFNPSQKVMTPNQNYAEFTNSVYNVDFLSNGFKIRNSSTPWNASGGTYIYMAFAEHPFVGDGVSPVTAR